MSECCFLFPQFGRVVILVMIKFTDVCKAHKPVECIIFFHITPKKVSQKIKHKT